MCVCLLWVAVCCYLRMLLPETVGEYIILDAYYWRSSIMIKIRNWKLGHAELF
jgi:hypothetical protein